MSHLRILQINPFHALYHSLFFKNFSITVGNTEETLALQCKKTTLKEKFEQTT